MLARLFYIAVGFAVGYMLDSKRRQNQESSISPANMESMGEAVEIEVVEKPGSVDETNAEMSEIVTEEETEQTADLLTQIEGIGPTYAKRRFRLTPHQRCGDHDLRTYLARIKALKHEFAKLSTGDKTIR